MIRPIFYILLCLGSWLHAVDVASVSPSAITVAENAPLTDITLEAKDSSGNVLPNVTYTLTTANGHWSLDGVKAPLQQTATYNFESGTETADKTIRFTAKNAGIGTTAVSFTITVTVTDVNETPTGIAPPGSQSINENVTGVVATYSSVDDPDTPTRNSYNWSLVNPPSGINDKDNFTIDSGTGQLSVTSAFDYETLAKDAANRRNGTTDKIFARVYVQLKDGSFGPFTQEIWFEVINVNETPTEIESSGSKVIDENVTGVVALCSGTGDPDVSGNSYVWSLVTPQNEVNNNNNNNFFIDPVSGQLSVTLAFNYEILAGIPLNQRNGGIFARAYVQLKDGTLDPIAQEVWIEVKNVNEAPTGIAVDDPLTINENVTGEVATCNGTGDPDTSGNNYTWSLIPATDGGIDDMAVGIADGFVINGSTGKLSVQGGFNYEAMRQSARYVAGTGLVTLRVQVKLVDGTLSGVTRYVSIILKDVNEPPVINGWAADTTLSDPTTSLRVGDDPGFSITDPDQFNEKFVQYDDLTMQVDLIYADPNNTNSDDEIGISADLRLLAVWCGYINSHRCSQFGVAGPI